MTFGDLVATGCIAATFGIAGFHELRVGGKQRPAPIHRLALGSHFLVMSALLLPLPVEPYGLAGWVGGMAAMVGYMPVLVREKRIFGPAARCTCLGAQHGMSISGAQKRNVVFALLVGAWILFRVAQTAGLYSAILLVAVAAGGAWFVGSLANCTLRSTRRFFDLADSLPAIKGSSISLVALSSACARCVALAKDISRNGLRDSGFVVTDHRMRVSLNSASTIRVDSRGVLRDLPTPAALTIHYPSLDILDVQPIMSSDYYIGKERANSGRSSQVGIATRDGECDCSA